MQRFVVAAVHELQQLNGEFDVAQPAGAQLDLAGPHPGGHQLLDATTHRLYSGTKSSRSHAVHTIGISASMYCSPSWVSPAAGRALSSAWNSQVLAHRLYRRYVTPACAPVARAYSGRSAASTSKNVSEANRIIAPATRVARARLESVAASATKMMSTSLT